jgi:hypothetical protein
MSTKLLLEREGSESRNAIQESFKATSALLNSLTESNKDNEAIKSKVQSLHSNIDDLMAGLVKDERSLYSSLAESYSRGELTADSIKVLIDTETKRTDFMTKMTAAMKVQLEQVFTVVEKLGDIAEKSSDDKILQKEINGLYLDFADLTQTVDNLTTVVKEPGKGVGEKISEFQYDIDTTLNTSPVAIRRASSIPINGLNISNLNMKLQEMVPEERTVTTEGQVKTATVDAIEEDVDEIKPPIRVKALIDRSSQTGQVEVNDMAIGASRPATEMKSEEGAASRQASKPSSAKANFPEEEKLVITGTKPMSSKEIADTARLQQLLAEKEIELSLRESLLMDQHKVLNARADELRGIAHKVVSRENTLQSQLAEISKTVDQRVEARVQAALAQRASGLPKDGEGNETAETDDTREFIEENMQQAQAQHVSTPGGAGVITATLASLTTDENEDDAFEETGKQSDILARVDGVIDDILAVRGTATPPTRLSPTSSTNGTPNMYTRKHLGTGGVSAPGSIGDAYTPTVLEAPGPNAISRDSQLDLLSKPAHDSGAAPITSLNVIRLGDDETSLPPPTDKVTLPEMIVIFPPKTKDMGTMTDYAKGMRTSDGEAEEGNPFHVRLSGDKIKTVMTTRAGRGDRGTKVGKKISTSSQAAVNKLKSQDLGTVTEDSGGAETAPTNTSVGIRKGPLQLVERDEMGVLETRTYRQIPPRDFHAVLRQSDNPLLEMVYEYGDHIDDVYKSALQQAAGVSAVAAASVGAIVKLFTTLLPDLEKLDASMLIVLKEVARCEELANNMIMVKGTGDVSDAHYRRSLHALFSKFGEVESMKAWVDVQLAEYRVVFERVDGLGITSLPGMLRQSEARTAYNAAAQALSSVSGRSVEAGSRFNNLKDRCARYDVASSFNPGSFSNFSGAGAGEVSFEDYLNMQSEVESLRDMLTEAEEENQELNLEVFRVMQEKDRTPAALLFFSILQDPVTTSVLQQMSLQLAKLKAFSEGDEHLEFAALRKRLQVCISCVPTVDRLVQRYNSLHKKWSVSRLANFMSKGLTGGGADSANVCPLCNNDPSATLAPASRSGAGSLGQPGKKENATQRQRLTEASKRAPKGAEPHTRTMHIKAKNARGLIEGQSMTDSTATEGTALPSINIPYV